MTIEILTSTCQVPTQLIMASVHRRDTFRTHIYIQPVAPGEEGNRWRNPDRGDIGNGMVPRAGEGDAEGEEAAEDGMWGDSGVLFPAVLSPAFLKRFKRGYSDSSRGTLGTRSGSSSLLRIVPSRSWSA